MEADTIASSIANQKAVAAVNSVGRGYPVLTEIQVTTQILLFGSLFGLIIFNAISLNQGQNLTKDGVQFQTLADIVLFVLFLVGLWYLFSNVGDYSLLHTKLPIGVFIGAD